MEWVVVGLAFLMFLLARRKSRKDKLDPLLFTTHAQIYMDSSFKNGFVGPFIEEFRSQVTLPEVLAFIHTAMFDSFDESMSQMAKNKRRTDVWAGLNKHDFYDSMANEFFQGAFGPEVAETTMRRIENSSLSAAQSELLTRRWVGARAVLSILVEIQLEALTSSQSQMQALLSKQRAEEFVDSLQPGYRTPEWTPGGLSRWDRLVFCARAHDYYLENEFESFVFSLRNAASDCELPLELWVEGSERHLWFEQSFYRALESFLGENLIVGEFGEALAFWRKTSREAEG